MDKLATEAMVWACELANARIDWAEAKNRLEEIRFRVSFYRDEIKASIDYTGKKNDTERDQALLTVIVNDTDYYKLQLEELDVEREFRQIEAIVKGLEDRLETAKIILAHVPPAPPIAVYQEMTPELREKIKRATDNIDPHFFQEIG